MNEALTIQIRNPHALREALLVAMEASWTDLSSDQVSVLKEFTLRLPQQIGPMIAQPTAVETDALLALHGYFRTSHTCYYLHDQLRAALVDLMTPLQKGAQT